MDKEEYLKEAFQKIKKDVTFLKQDFEVLKKGLIETREKILDLCNLIKILNEKIKKNIDDSGIKDSVHNSTTQHINTTILAPNLDFKPNKHQNLGISTGNHGVPTDKQTNRQTDKQTNNGSHNIDIIPKKEIFLSPKSSIEDASKILDSLDSLKKEIRLRFKRLTDQEILVFSALYQIEEEHEYADYKSLSDKLSLTESSIRDYVGKLIKKGIPIDKMKINNKNIHLSISKNLKKIASLQSILSLRDL